jgi:hypothetical protein
MFGAALVALLPAAAAMAGEPAVKKEREGAQDVRRHRVVVHPGEEPEVMFWKEGDERGRAFNLLLGRGFLGVQTTELTPDLRRHFGVSEEAGVLIGHVEPDSPADKAGLEVGDVLVQVDGEPVESAWDLGRAVRKKKDGDTAALEVWRDGRAQTLTATIAERERPALDVRRLRCEPGEECDFEMIGDPAVVLGPAMKRLQGLLGDEEMQERLTRFRSRNQELEQRLQQLEQRLQELEKQLAKGQK